MATIDTKLPETPAAHNVGRSTYAVRFATVYLTVDHDLKESAAQIARRLRDALNQDSRVLSVSVPKLDESWSHQYAPYYASEGPDDSTHLIEGTRHFHTQVFSDPLALKVHVPKKNQPALYEDSEVPTEDYYVLWNGQTLLVAWDHDDSPYIPSSGGHILEPILEEATERIDAGIYVQPCNPSCKHVFLHRALLVQADPSAPAWSVVVDGDDPETLHVRAATDDQSLEDMSESVWFQYGSALRNFADMKNVARKILDLEAVVRYDLDRLNSLHHSRASEAQGPWKGRISALWKQRGWRRKSRYYLARLWLGLGTLESASRFWMLERGHFVRSAREADIEPLFVIDASDETAYIEALDLTLIEASIEHAGGRLDSGALVTATVGGALAGALIASVITAFH